MGYQNPLKTIAVASLILPCLIPGLTGAGLPLQEDDLVQRYESADAHFFKAEELFLKQDFPNARVEIAECLKLMPEHSEGHYLLAQIEYRQGFLSRALNHISKAEEYYDFSAKVRGEQRERLLLELQRMRDEQESILSDLRRILAHTSDQVTRASLEERILQVQRIKTSIEDRLLSPRALSAEGPAEYHLLHGMILAALRRYPHAQRELRLAIQIEPTSSESYERLAGILLVSGQPAKALEVIEEAESRGITVEEGLKKDVLKALEKQESAAAGSQRTLRAAAPSPVRPE